MDSFAPVTARPELDRAGFEISETAAQVVTIDGFLASSDTVDAKVGIESLAALCGFPGRPRVNRLPGRR